MKHDSQNVSAPHTQRELAQAEMEAQSASARKMRDERIAQMIAEDEAMGEAGDPMTVRLSDVETIIQRAIDALEARDGKTASGNVAMVTVGAVCDFLIATKEEIAGLAKMKGEAPSGAARWKDMADELAACLFKYYDKDEVSVRDAKATAALIEYANMKGE